MNRLLVMALCICVTGALPQPQKVIQVQKREQPHPHRTHYNVHAHEGGALVEEKVNVDEDRGLVSYYVPPHNIVDEAEFVYDFVNNVTLQIFPQAKECYIADLDKRQSQDPKTTNLAFKSADKKDTVVNTVESVTYVIDEEKLTATDVLPPDLAVRCAGMTVSRLRPMQESFSFDSNGSDGQTRAKRFATGDPCDNCKRSKCEVRRNACHYFVMCGTMINKHGERVPDCSKQQSVHKFSNNAVCTVCCNLQELIPFPPIPHMGFPGGDLLCKNTYMKGKTSSFPAC